MPGRRELSREVILQALASLLQSATSILQVHSPLRSYYSDSFGLKPQTGCWNAHSKYRQLLPLSLGSHYSLERVNDLGSRC